MASTPAVSRRCDRATDSRVEFVPAFATTHALAADGLLHRAPERDALVALERLAFAGRAGHDEPVVAAVDEPAREALRFAQIELAALVERRHHRGENRSEAVHSVITGLSLSRPNSLVDRPLGARRRDRPAPAPRSSCCCRCSG